MITVYSTPTCPWCIRAKEFLKQNNVSFKDIDVSRDRAGAMEMIEKSGQMGVPVIDINGEIIIGFDRERIKELLKIK
ncbi:MAG: glutaredoxin family protein [Candidatus Woesearchaeota archaeon]